MKITFALWIISFILHVVPYLGGSVNKEELATINENISKLKHQIKNLESTGGNDIEKANILGNIGLLLQLKDIRVHEGGGALQPEALDCFNKALALAKDNDIRLRISINQHKGILLKMMGRGEEALIAHDTVYELSVNKFDQASAIYHKAEAFTMLGRVKEAIQLYKRALTIQPDGLATYLPLVKGLKELNEYSKEEWKELLKEIQKKLKNYDDGKYDMSEYESAMLWQSTSGELSSEVYWALFELADKIGEQDLAWRYLEQAHAMQKRKFTTFDEPLDDSKTESILGVFKEGFWPSPAVGLDSMVPVFIVGMMRSGSTLTETMLDAHGEIWGMGEDSVFNPVLDELRNDLVEVLSKSGKTNDAVKKVVQKYGKRVVAKMLSLASTATTNTTRSGKVKRVVDKMLFNYRNIGFIHLVFPNAVIIHTIRDPLDTLLSCYKHKFDDGGLEWSLDPEHLVFEYVQYLEIMHHFRTVLPGRVTDVSYEEMVRDPEKVIRGVIGKLGLDWDPNVMQFHKTNRTVQTHSMAQVRHSVYSKSVGGWRKYASHMKPFIEAFNKFIPQLKERGALPFPDDMNWKFDVNFDYGFGPMETTAATVATNTSNDVSSSSDSEDMKLSKKTSSKSKSSKDKSNKNKNKKSNKKNNKNKKNSNDDFCLEMISDEGKSKTCRNRNSNRVNSKTKTKKTNKKNSKNKNKNKNSKKKKKL
eukprot:gene36186-47054_t